MAYIKDIVINITRATKALLLAGFGKALIVGKTAPYYSATLLSGNAGIIWRSVTRGTVHVQVVYVDPEENSQSLSVARTGSGTSEAPYIITVSLATDSGGEITTTATQLKAAAEAVSTVAGGSKIVDLELTGNGSGIVSAVSAVTLSAQRYQEFSELLQMADYYGSDTAEYKMAAAMFAQSPRPTVVAVYSRDVGSNLADVLTAIRSINDTWYALLIADRTKAEIHVAGTWANSNKKLFFGCSDDITILDDRNNDREILVCHTRPEDYPEAAWVGQNLNKAPGSITWKWKQLNGQIAASYDMTELNTIREKNGQTLTEFSGAIIMNEGKTTSGEFIDVIHGQDWVEAMLEADLFKLATDNEKIPFDNDGISQVESVIRARMRIAGNAGIIAKAVTDEEQKRSDDGEYLYTVTVPTRDEVSSQDRGARHLPDVAFSYELAGAIHRITVNGKITA